MNGVVSTAGGGGHAQGGCSLEQSFGSTLRASSPAKVKQVMACARACGLGVAVCSALPTVRTCRSTMHTLFPPSVLDSLTPSILPHPPRAGEGKTLVAVLPSYLNALAGKGVHVVTVNDYLARRDSEWVGQVPRFLGMQVRVCVGGGGGVERGGGYVPHVVAWLVNIWFC